jgi:hypothetical protein
VCEREIESVRKSVCVTELERERRCVCAYEYVYVCERENVLKMKIYF